MKSSEAEDWHNFKRLKKLRSYTEFQLLRQLKLRCYSDLKFWKTGRPGAPQYSFPNYRAIPKSSLRASRQALEIFGEKRPGWSFSLAQRK